MSDLFLTPEQTGQLFATPGPFTLRDAAGNIVGQVRPPAAAAGSPQITQQSSAELAARFPVPEDALAALCRQYGVQRLGLFGSALREDFGPDSDLDLLVEFEPGWKVGLKFFSLERELSELAGRKVDLNTPAFLSQHFRGEVLSRRRSHCMTQHNDLNRLRHMVEHGQEASAMAAAYSRQDLETNRMLALALVRLLEIVGEAAARVTPPTQALVPLVPWPEIVDLRNRLIHGYDSVDFDILWEIIQSDLPPLVSVLQGFLIDADHPRQADP